MQSKENEIVENDTRPEPDITPEEYADLKRREEDPNNQGIISYEEVKKKGRELLDRYNKF